MSLSFQKLTRAVNQTLDEEIYSTPELCLNLLQLSSTKTLCQTDSFITLILIDQCQVSISHESNTLVKLEYFTPITFDASKEIKIYNNSSNYNSHGNSIIMHSSSDGKDHGNSAKFDQGTVDKNNQTTRILWFVQKKGTKVSFQIENLVHSNGKNDLGGSTRDCLPAITSNDASTAKNAPKNDFSNNHETGDDLFSNVKTNDHGTTPINTILLGSMTILYVLKGSVKVVLGESTDSRVKEDLEVDQACVFNKDDENTPTDLSITPLATQDATVLIIQIHLSKPSSASLTVPPKPPTRSGSIIVFDDQPMIWNLSPPTLLMRRDSGDVSPTPNLSLKFYESAQHYHPPIFSDRHRLATQVPSPKIVDTLVIEDFPRGQVSTVWVNMVKQGLSDWIKVPVIIARGVEDGPVVSHKT